MEIKSVGDMRGLFATKTYTKGEVVLRIEGDVLSTPTRTTIQIAPNTHVDVDAPGKYINHSCNANCFVRKRELIAINDIAIGDEITFNYQENEDELAHPFICKDCGKMIEGKKKWKPDTASAVEHISSMH